MSYDQWLNSSPAVLWICQSIVVFIKGKQRHFAQPIIEMFANCYSHNALDKALLLWFIMYRVSNWLRVPRWAYEAQVQHINDSTYLAPPSRFFEEILIHNIQDTFHFAGRNDLIASMADRAYHRKRNGMDRRCRHLQRATMRKCRAIKLELEGLCAAILAARIFFLRDTDCKVIEKSLNGSLTMYQEYMLDHLPDLLETTAPILGLSVLGVMKYNLLEFLGASQDRASYQEYHAHPEYVMRIEQKMQQTLSAGIVWWKRWPDTFWLCLSKSPKICTMFMLTMRQHHQQYELSCWMFLSSKRFSRSEVISYVLRLIYIGMLI